MRRTRIGISFMAPLAATACLLGAGEPAGRVRIEPSPGPARDVRFEPGPDRVWPAPADDLVSGEWWSGEWGERETTHPSLLTTHSRVACETTTGGPSPFAEHRTGAYVEWLHLSPRGADVRYATPVVGLGPTAVPVGEMDVAHPDQRFAVRAGLFHTLSPESSLTLNYTHFESQNGDSISVAGGTAILRADLVHPNTVNAAADSLDARGEYGIDFDLADASCRALLLDGPDSSLNAVVGFRYGELKQDLAATYTILGATLVKTQLDFRGFGPRVGLEGEHRLSCCAFVYGRSGAGLLAGEFDARYLQANTFAGRQVETGFNDRRVVVLSELELGVGWQNERGDVRATVGYSMMSWSNVLTPPAFVRSIQSNGSHADDETLTFDGLAARIEYRF